MARRGTMRSFVRRRLLPKDGGSFLTHFVSLLVAIPASLLLLDFAADGYGLVGGAVFGFGLIGVFAGSSICHHGWGCGQAWQEYLDRYDRVGIYLMIACTLTPVCLALRSPLAILRVIRDTYAGGRVG